MKFDTMAFPQEYLWRGFDGLIAERVGAGGAFPLSQPLHPAGVFHHLDGRMAVLRAVADVEPAAWGNAAPGSVVFAVKQCCVSISAVFLLWGSLRFLGLPVPQTLFGVFMLFLVVWILSVRR